MGHAEFHVIIRPPNRPSQRLKRIATGLLLAVATFWGFLTTFGVASAVPMWTAVPVWCLGLGLGHVIGKVRGL